MTPLPPSDHRLPMSSDVEHILTCPISRDFMHDPVTIVQSQMTCDHESLCQWMLHHPTTCPLTGEDFGEHLEYIDNISVRQMLTLYRGDEQFIRFVPNLKDFYNAGCRVCKGDGVMQDYQKAWNLFKFAAAQGDALAQYGLGWLYVSGHGVQQDYVKAKHYFMLAAAQNNAKAKFSLGSLYAGGLGVPRDCKKATVYYELAAAQGDVQVQVDVGLKFYYGEIGAIPDYQKAMEYFKLAAAKGNARAQANVGLLFLDGGYGVQQDYRKALHWFKLSAAQSYAPAICDLGLLYSGGHGVARDDAKAREYYELAVSQGYNAAQRPLDSLLCRQRYGKVCKIPLLFMSVPLLALGWTLCAFAAFALLVGLRIKGYK